MDKDTANGVGSIVSFGRFLGLESFIVIAISSWILTIDSGCGSLASRRRPRSPTLEGENYWSWWISRHTSDEKGAVGAASGLAVL